jgi:hypothetical protein
MRSAISHALGPSGASKQGVSGRSSESRVGPTARRWNCASRRHARGRGAPAHGKLPVGDLYVMLRVSLGIPDPALETFLKDWTPEAAINPRAAMETAP